MEPTPEEAVDESIDQLKELAQRQQQLADAAARDNQMSLAERWQQEQLQRELEELQEQLEQLQQQQNAQNGGQEGSQSNQSAGSASSQAIQDAVDALSEATRQSQQASSSPEQLRDAMDEAQRQINNAVEELSRERQQQLGESFADLTDRAEELFDQQQRVAAELQRALRQSVADKEAGEEFSSGLSRDEEDRLADIKREMAGELAAIEQQMRDTAVRSEETMPESTSTLEEALVDLQEQDAVNQLNEAALEIEYGYAPYTAVREVLTTTALNNLRFSLQQAEQLAQSESQDPGNLGENDPRQASAEEQVRQLRLALEDAMQGQGQGQQNADGQASENGGSGQDQSASAAAQGGNQAAAGGDNQMQGGNGNFNAGGFGMNGPNPDARPPIDWTLPSEFSGQTLDAETLDALPAEVLRLSSALQEAGIDPLQLNDLQRMARDLANQNPERLDAIINAQYQEMLGLLEKMELSLSSEEGRPAISPLTAERDSIGDEDEVAEYFRGLSDQPVGEAN
jgi:hypothetical protein